MDAKNRAEVGENLFHIFVDLHERAPSNVFDKYISPIFSIAYDKDVLIRKRDAKEVAKTLEEVAKVFRDNKENGNLVFEELLVRVPGAGVVANDIEISLSGKDEKSILEGLTYLADEFSKIEGVQNISNDADIGEKELKLRVNSYGQQLGFNEEIISSQLRSYYLKGEYGKMFNESGLIRMKIESGANERLNSINTMEIQVPTTNQYIALKEVCDFVMIQGFVELKKEDGIRIRSIFASLDKKVITSTEVMSMMRPAFEKLKNDGFKVDIKGEEKENNKNKNEMFQSALIAIF